MKTALLLLVACGFEVEAATSPAMEDPPPFAPLQCNNEISTCKEWNEMNFDLNAKIVIPCGECVIVGCSITSIDAIMGIDVQGKLVFKDYSNECGRIPSSVPQVTLTAPFVHVQGELEMRSSRATSGTPDVKFIITGMQDTPLVPHPENAAACPQGTCTVGKKAIAIAGGKLQINGLPQNCKTWSTLHDVVALSSPVSFPHQALPTSKCHQQDLVEYTFDDKSYQGWNSHWSPGGFEIQNDLTSTFFVARGRSATWQGPMLDMRNHVNCIVPGTNYYFRARVKLIPNTTGTVSSCQAHGKNCPKFTFFSEVRNDDGTPEKTWDVKMRAPSVKLVDGEWFEMFGIKTFSKMEAESTDNMRKRFFLEGPEAGIDIAVDDFKISLTPPFGFQYDTKLPRCQSLTPFNGNASSSIGLYPFPFARNDGRSNLIVREEQLTPGQKNRYFALSDRVEHWSSLRFHIDPGCVVQGYTYSLSMNLRVHDVEAVKVNLQRYREENGAKKSWKTMTSCGKLTSSDGWVKCSVDVTFEEEDESATRFDFHIYTDSTKDQNPDIDFDDIAFEFKSGPVTNLIVKSEGIENCWGGGSDLLVTSHTQNWEGSSTVALESVKRIEDGSFSLSLKSPYLPSSLALGVSPESFYNPEVALLSRNVVFEGSDDDSANPLHGGHLIVLRTPGVSQTIDGLEVRRFGQQKNLGRYPIHFHMSESVKGSSVSRNTVRESFQRCFVIHGSHNISVSENVAYDTHGHCFLLEDGGEMHNVVTDNLVALTKTGARIRDEETDDTPSSYWITNPQNTFQRNVAAGSQGSGFWFEMRREVRFPTSKFQNLNPSELALVLFEDNVAHSNNGHGVHTYPGAGYNPKSQGQATFKGTRSYRNGRAGLFIHNSKNIAVRGGIFADNRWQIDIDRASGCSVHELSLIGYSPEYKQIVDQTGSWTHCKSDRTIRGLQLHTYFGGGSKYLGTEVKNTSFEHFGAAVCPAAAGLSVEYYENKGFFDVRSTLSGLKFDATEMAAKINLCESLAAGIDNVAIYDKDGSVMGSTGFIVSDSTRMTTFPPSGTCVAQPGTCAAFCPDTCFRAWSASVSNYSPPELELEVTDKATGSSIQVTGIYDTPSKEDDNTQLWRKRRFFASIPASGKYSFRFLLDGKDYWPRFVESKYEDQPGACGADFLETDIIMPADEDCSELIVNGEMETISHWWSTNGGLLLKEGGLTNAERSQSWHGIAQYLDSRCLVEGKHFTLTAKVKMFEKDGVTPFVCAVSKDNCPKINLKASKGQGYDEYDQEWKGVGKLQGSWQAGQWNEFAGDFTVSQKQGTAHSIYLYTYGPPRDIIVVWDNMSIVPKAEALTVTCGASIVDDKFSGGSFRHWDGHGAAYSVIDTNAQSPGDQYFIVKDRKHNWQGPHKDADIACADFEKTYLVSFDARLSKKDNTTSSCHKNIGTGSHKGCLQATLISEDKNSNGSSNQKQYYSWGAAIPHRDGEWYRFEQEVTLNSQVTDMVHKVARRISLHGPEPGVDIAMDNFTLTEKVCTDIIAYHSFDKDTYEGWNGHWSPGGYMVTALKTNATNNKHFWTPGRTRSWMGPKLDLNVGCIDTTPGAQYEISAKLFHSRSDGNPSNCQSTGQKCLSLTLYTETFKGEKSWSSLGSSGIHRDDQWYDFSSTVSFTTTKINPTTIKHHRLYFGGPEAGVDIGLDDFKIEKVY